MSAKIIVNSNGPLKVEGDFMMMDGNGIPYELAGKKAVFICRCGQTKKSPYCDGTHKSCGFVSEAKGDGGAARA